MSDLLQVWCKFHLKKIICESPWGMVTDLQIFMLVFQSYNDRVPIPPPVPILHHQWSQYPAHPHILSPTPPLCQGIPFCSLSLLGVVVCNRYIEWPSCSICSDFQHTSPISSGSSRHPLLGVPFSIWAAFSPSTWSRLPSCGANLLVLTSTILGC